MLTRQISLKHDITVKAVNITQEQEIQLALAELHIPRPSPVIVLVGGASGMAWLDTFPMRKAIKIISQLAEETQSVVVDGGTQAGIMTEIGRQRKQHKFSFPLVGVVFDHLLLKREPESILDPNHTHFFLVPGNHWGDESAWISKIATQIAGDKKSITILVNGGQISRADVGFSVLEDRPTFVMRGTGRMADEIALGDKILAVDVSQKPDDISEFLKSRLI
jgi:TRPM family ion channel